MKASIVTFLLVALAGCLLVHCSHELQAKDNLKGYKFFKQFMIDIEVPDIIGDCFDAVTSLSSIYSDCKSTLDIVFTNETVGNVSFVSDYCESTCRSRLDTAILDLTDSCALDELQRHGIISNSTLVEIARFLNVPCIKLEGEFCLPIFFKFLYEMASGNDNLTASQLENACHPCVDTLLKLNIEYGDAEARNNLTHLDVMCLKDGERFCYPVFVEFMYELNTTNLTDPTSPLNVSFCDRCVYRIQARLYELSENETTRVLYGQQLNYTEHYCTQNPVNGRSCLETFQQGHTFETACEGFEQNGCTTTCRSAIESLLVDGGCCVRDFMEVVAADRNVDPNVFISTVATQCSLTLPEETCPRYYANFSLELGNIKLDYYESNSGEIQQLAARDIAINAGVTSDNVRFLGAEVSTESIRLNYEIVVRTVEDSQVIVIELMNLLERNAFILEYLAMIPFDALMDATTGVYIGVNPQASSALGISATLSTVALLLPFLHYILSRAF